MTKERLRIGDEIEGTVSDFGMSGEGIVKLGAYPVFVPFAIVGEQVKIKITYAKKDYAFGELIEVLSPSKDRIKPRCRYFGRCGGCDLQHLDAPMQEEVKRLNLVRTLMKNAGLDIVVPEVVSGARWAYRNKLSLPLGSLGKHGKTVLGFYEKKSHWVVPMKSCPLHGDWADKLIAAVTAWANENGIKAYDEKTGKGQLRHLVARYVTTLSVTVVVNGDNLPHADNLVKKLDAVFDGYALYVCPNKTRTNVIMGDSVKLIHGKETPQELGAFSAVVSPLSFLQVNDEIRDRLYSDVCKALDGFEGDIVELYSGVGLLTAEIASRLPDAEITAVEIVPSAVDDARSLMKKLGLDGRVTEICADAVEYMSSLETSEKCRAVVVDPPRKGCDAPVLEGIVKADFGKIVYVSCNPATLARDLKFLLANGYTLTSIQPYDMFPQTMHVETLVVLEKVGQSKKCRM